MDLTSFLLTITAGFGGTLVMTAVMYLYAYLTHENTKVVHLLGTMVTGSLDQAANGKPAVLLTGIVAHVSVGVLFSLTYFLLWNWGVFDISWLDSLIVGAISGLIAIVVWRLYFMVHQNPPKVSLKHYFIALFIAHIVFGAATVNIYRLITDSPQFYFQFQQKVEP